MRTAAMLSTCALMLSATAGSMSVLAKDSPYAKLDMAPEKTGPYTDAIDIRTLCGAKPVRVALFRPRGISMRRLRRPRLSDDA
jgi:hypothetical protein